MPLEPNKKHWLLRLLQEWRNSFLTTLLCILSRTMTTTGGAYISDQIHYERCFKWRVEKLVIGNFVAASRRKLCIVVTSVSLFTVLAVSYAGLALMADESVPLERDDFIKVLLMFSTIKLGDSATVCLGCVECCWCIPPYTKILRISSLRDDKAFQESSCVTREKYWVWCYSIWPASPLQASKITHTQLFLKRWKLALKSLKKTINY